MRAPLGVYNISTSRVCGKVVRLCERLESLFKHPDPWSRSREISGAYEVVLDYMELAVYAAAEHVDDLYAIASAYLPNDSVRAGHPAFRSFDKAVKHHKRFISSLANAIKHEHFRLRLCAVEFWHDRRPVTFYGYFVEGVKEGVLGPSGRFHSEQELFSVTALAWDILGFVLSLSLQVADLIRGAAVVHSGPHNCTADGFLLAVVAAARLPLYTFGEPHLFDKATVNLHYLGGELVAPLESDLYGSLHDRWSLSEEHEVGRMDANLVGDGSSRSFRLPQPRQIAIKHWTNPH
jgi:hypothetical protein